MGKIIDISAKLCVEDKFLQVAEGKDFKIDDRKNTVIKANKMIQDDPNDPEIIDKIIRLTLGEKAFKEIEAMNLPFSAYQSVFIGIMAAIQDKSYEEVEKSFRKQEAN